jgi:ankyrin repeat protein
MKLNDQNIQIIINVPNIIFTTIFAIILAISSVAYADSDDEQIIQLLKQGQTFFINKQYDKSLEIYNKVIEADSENSYAYLARGNVYLSKRAYNQAIKDFNKSLELNSAAYRNYALLGFTYENMGNKDKAKEYCKLFFQYANPNDPLIPNVRKFMVDANLVPKIYTESKNNGNSTMNDLLIQSVEKNDLEMIQTAVNRGANVNIYIDATNWETPLTIAACKQNIEIVDFLIDHGADPNVIVQNTPFILKYLSYNNEWSLNFIQHLVDRGADITAYDSNGNNVFMRFYNTWNSYEYKKNMTKYFISMGVSVNCQNTDGETPLHKAAERGYADIVKIMLEAGADPNKTNNQFKKPLDYAVRSGNKDTINLLLSVTK